MRKLLTASLLLASCTLQLASAQKATAPHHKSTTKPNYSSPTWLPDWAAAEFCEAYSRHFLDLPYLYKHNASQVLRNTPLANPNANLTSMLAKDVTLREAVYKTIYQFCYTAKYGYSISGQVDELVYLMLYRDLHLSNLAATQLTMHIASRYKQPEAPLASTAEASAASKVADKVAEKDSATEREEQKVYTYVEQMPALPGGGGIVAITTAIQRQVQYSEADVRDDVAGKIDASFLVDEAGVVSGATIVRGLSTTLNAEVIRAIRSLPTFIPGRQNDQPVKVQLTVHVPIRASERPIASRPSQQTKAVVKVDATTSPADLELVGWRFDNPPTVDATDNERGLIRFKIKISDKGEVESVSKQAGNVSPAQEKECRDKLLNAHFIKADPAARATTGFYTFRFGTH
jgi:hypothetical protein